MRIDLPALLTQPIVEPTWLVKGIFARSTMIVVAGEQGVGKSTLGYHLALTLAPDGPRFLGLVPTQSTRVLYIDEENSKPDMAKYFSRAWHGLGCPSVDHIQFEHFSLPERWLPVLLKLARAWQPGLVIIDTANSALHLIDENDNAEASRAIHGLRQVQAAAANDTTLIVLKHERQRDDVGHRRTIRGAKTWLGQADAVFYHCFAPGSKKRRNGLRLTQLEQDKLRSFGLDAPIKINPSWTGDDRKGLILQGIMSVPTEVDDPTET
jgi:archaellum biogenesis ATPase FlaH